MVLTLAVLGILILPLTNDQPGRGMACVNNLRLIQFAKEQWAQENKKEPNDLPVPFDMQAYMGRGTNGILP